MSDTFSSHQEKAVLQSRHLGTLLEVLRKSGYQVVGPTRREGAIVYDELASVNDLPIGWTDQQDGGKYQLVRREDQAFFGYVVGPQSWKKYLHPPALRLWRAQRNGGGFQVMEEAEEITRYAFLGVRACELHAIAIQDQVFMNGAYVDPHYRRQREQIFIVAVNCVQAGRNCFCASQHTGPQAISGFDLALTEIYQADRHYFVVEAGSAKGEEVLRALPHQRANAEEQAIAARLMQQATEQMGRTLDTTEIKSLLYRNTENPRWDEVARRCLACANCTMVCPTCFCTTVEDVTDLTGEHAERWRKWDSCFTMDFSYIHGGSIRVSAKARYRQWLTHKLGTWSDQFGVSGCVGCGRCITWCPVGIDLTEEVRALRASEGGSSAAAPRADSS